MPDIASFPPNYFGNLWLVFIRVGAMIFAAPLLNGRAVPVMLKIGLAGLLAFLLVPFGQGNFAEVPFEWVPLTVLTIKELGVGVILGYVVNLVFSGMQFAGQIVGLEVGFSFANVVDPLYQQSVSLVDQFYTILASLIFLAIGGLEMLILSVQQTLDLIPVGSLNLTGSMVDQLITLSSGVFVVGVRIALPIMAAVLLADVALGLVGRTMPQMNVFVVGLPLKIAIGFLILIVTLPAVQGVASGMFQSSFSDVANVLKLSAA